MEFGIAQGRRGDQALQVRVLDAPPRSRATSRTRARKKPEEMVPIVEDLIRLLDGVGEAYRHGRHPDARHAPSPTAEAARAPSPTSCELYASPELGRRDRAGLRAAAHRSGVRGPCGVAQHEAPTTAGRAPTGARRTSPSRGCSGIAMPTKPPSTHAS